MQKRLIFGTLLLGVSLWGVIQFAPLMVNPGEVTVGHRKIEETCFGCHTPFLGIREANCLVCHEMENIGGTIQGKPAFHQQLKESDCTACHTDHQGRERNAATQEFTHRLLVGEILSGCQNCHTKPADTLHTKLDTGCADCHQTEKWKPATLDHSRYFRFDRHHETDCATCHQAETFDRYTCYGCHEHTPAKVEREHWEEGIRDFQQCTICHRSGDEHEAERIWRDIRRRGLTPPRAEESSRFREDREGTRTPRRYGWFHDDDDD